MGRNAKNLINADTLIKKIEKLKIKVQKETGSFKYDWCYDECIDAIHR